MKKYFTLACALCFFAVNAQNVGINTTSPKATLDVQKTAALTFADGIIPPRISGDSLKLKENAYNASHDGTIIYATSPITPSGAVKTKYVNTKGLYIYDASFVNTGNLMGIWNAVKTADPKSAAYAIRATGDLGLINLGINFFGSNIRTIPLSNIVTADYKVDIASANIAANKYTVPSTGIYHIDYSYRVGQGIRAELLGNNRPGVIIIKTDNGSTSRQELDSRLFGGLEILDIGVSAVNISLTQAQISHLYSLNEGDVLEFGVVSGGLSIGLLTDASAELSIHKIN